MSCDVINPTAALTDLGRHIACEITTLVASLSNHIVSKMFMN